MLFSNPSIEALIAAAVALLVGLTFHEFSHALLADQLGDHRPRAMGRLTLNPIPHIDPVGALMLLIAGFGWAKPVLVNPAALRGGRNGMAIVAAAGPIANVLVAIAFSIVYRVLDLVAVQSDFVMDLLALIVLLNIVLAIFNLIPIPPLDGSNVLLAFLPPRQALAFQRYTAFGVIVLLILILLPGGPLSVLFGWARAIAEALIGA
jgi:Zn-dependent protease